MRISDPRNKVYIETMASRIDFEAEKPMDLTVNSRQHGDEEDNFEISFRPDNQKLTRKRVQPISESPDEVPACSEPGEIPLSRKKGKV